MDFSPVKPIQTETLATQKQEFKKIGSIRLKPGMKLYKFNPTTLILSEVITQNIAAISLSGETILELKAFHDPNVVYFTAINPKNAIKKAQKWLHKVLKNKFVNLKKS